jgi:N4-gp56 family major capsid protein
MALTNFAALTPEQKIVWSRDVWKEARDMSFINKFVGTGENSVIQRITELTKTEKGEKVLMHLLADLVDDGVVGDNEREGNEEEMMTYTDDITIDLISHGVRQKGKLADQKTVVAFREHAKGVLSYWLANRIDQLAMLTLAGIGYDKNCDGSARTSGAFASLAFAADVAGPTTNRHFMVSNDGTDYLGLVAGNTAAMVATNVLTYSAIVDIVTKAKTNYMKPLLAGGKEYYVAFVRPEGLAQLKKDPDFQRAVITGLPRSDANPFFSGGTVTVDGLVFHEHRLVYNTLGATSGVDKWGAGSDINGARMLVCGSQALGMADLGNPEWSEKMFNYDSSPGINVDKMFGLLKPKFYSIYSKSVEDFGVMCIDHAI